MAILASMAGALLFASACWSDTGTSLPRFDTPVQLPGEAIAFPDATADNVLYYVPDSVSLAHEGNEPAFGLFKTVHVSTGVDGGRSGGILTLRFERRGPSLETREQWRASRSGRVEFRPLPTETMRLRLMIPAPGEGGLREVVMSDKSFYERTVTVRLNAAATTLLWDALHEAGGPVVQADVTLVTPGFVRNEEGEFEETERTDRYSIPLEVSRTGYPSLFRTLDQSQRINFNYRDLTVYCFGLNSTESVTEFVLVELAVKNEQGQRRIRTVSFRPGGEQIGEIAFDVAEERGSKYEYRVARYFKEGETHRTNWQVGETANLDVCSDNETLNLE